MVLLLCIHVYIFFNQTTQSAYLQVLLIIQYLLKLVCLFFILRNCGILLLLYWELEYCERADRQCGLHWQ